ncbi:MAG: hypothetical protein R3A12_03590 [Ignavibacteria bacterium]
MDSTVLFAITGNTGTQIWSASLGSGNNGKITILDDADSNGFSDFTLSAPQVAYRIDSKTGVLYVKSAWLILYQRS